MILTQQNLIFSSWTKSHLRRRRISNFEPATSDPSFSRFFFCGLSKPHAGTAAVLVDELDAGGAKVGRRSLRSQLEIGFVSQKASFLPLLLGTYRRPTPGPRVDGSHFPSPRRIALQHRSDQPFFTSGQADSLSERNASSPGITARSL